MRKLILLAVVALSTSAFAATWNNVILIDSMCAKTAKDNPDAHTRECALGCAGSGMGILTDDGKFLKFDKHGNDLALALLKNSDKKDHLRVNVEGKQTDKVIEVQSVKF